MPTSRDFMTPNGLLAFCITLVSMSIGAAYYLYLESEPFPPDIARYVPFIWFLGAIGGLTMGLQAAITGTRRYLGLLSVLVNLPNIPLAAILAFAAMMGD